MAGSVQCVVVDCSDIHSLAEFYRRLLGGRVNARDRRWRIDDTWATLHTASGPVLAFQRVDDHQPPQWTQSTRPQQIHLDIAVDDLSKAHRDALSYGATLLDAGEPDRAWRVYADPAGHPFCLVEQTDPVRPDQRHPTRSPDERRDEMSPLDLPDTAELRNVDVSRWPTTDRALLDVAVTTLDALIMACKDRIDHERRRAGGDQESIRACSELADRCRRELKTIATVDDVTRVIQEYAPRLREMSDG